MRVAVHVFDGITMFHLAAPLLVFGEIGRLDVDTPWTTTVWSTDRRGVRTAEGMTLEATTGPEGTDDCDLLVLPSWHADFRPTEAALTDVIRRVHARGGRVAGLCLGAFPVADSGLLHGRAAVTHWAAAARLRERHPDVEVAASALYVDHGDVLTSAGTAAAFDACLHLVRRELGSTVAATVARHLVLAPHRDGHQAQYVERPLPDPDTDNRLGRTMEWAIEQLGRPIGIDEMAAHARMSRRNFTRRFREVTGTTPAAWLRSRRLDDARQLLERTTWPISRIASRCGFDSAVTFRQSFAAAYGATPTSYRQRFVGASGSEAHHRERPERVAYGVGEQPAVDLAVEAGVRHGGDDLADLRPRQA